MKNSVIWKGKFYSKMGVNLIIPAPATICHVECLANALAAKSGFEKFRLVSLISVPSLLVILGLNLTDIIRNDTVPHQRATKREAHQAARFDLPVHVQKVIENNGSVMKEHC